MKGEIVVVNEERRGRPASKQAMDMESRKLARLPAHKLTHQDGGADEVSVTGLSGLLADDQHVLDAEVVLAVYTGLARITVGTNSPGSPGVGDLWVDTS